MMFDVDRDRVTVDRESNVPQLPVHYGFVDKAIF